MTNFRKIKSMTQRELIDFLLKHQACVDAEDDDLRCREGDDCASCWERWMNRKAK